MELRSIDGESSISLTDWEVDDFGVKAAIAVRDHDFAGAHDEVWFAYNASEAFIQALGQFSIAHEGEARLESMEDLGADSLGEVVLSIRRLDLARHVLVVFSGDSSSRLGSRLHPSRVSHAQAPGPLAHTSR